MLRIFPHDGIGGCTPRPRNDSADSVRIAPPTPKRRLPPENRRYDVRQNMHEQKDARVEIP